MILGGVRKNGAESFVTPQTKEGPEEIYPQNWCGHWSDRRREELSFLEKRRDRLKEGNLTYCRVVEKVSF